MPTPKTPPPPFSDPEEPVWTYRGYRLKTSEFVTAMRHGLGLNKILGTIHVYPTFAEANKYAAGAWKKAHAPERTLARLEKLHAWMRG